MMEAVVIVAGACQLASWLFAVVDAIEAPQKKESPSPLAWQQDEEGPVRTNPKGAGKFIIAGPLPENKEVTWKK